MSIAHAPRIAVVVPCYNEEMTIAKVVQGFREALPNAEIWVCDNASSDGTRGAAIAAGARVLSQPLKGKGHAVRRLFGDVDADIYVLVDGDATYDAASAVGMIDALSAGRLDMVVGRRVETSQGTYRTGHRLGNAAFTFMVATLFGNRVRDLLSGYRVLSRRYVKSFPVRSDGFQLETEMTVHALELGMPMAEHDTPYFERPSGSVSKLSTYRDGFRILRMVARLLLDLKPAWTLGVLATFSAMVSVGLALPLVLHFVATGLVPRLPTAVLCCGLSLLSAVFGCAGLVLDGVARARREAKQLAYLNMRPLVSEVA